MYVLFYRFVHYGASYHSLVPLTFCTINHKRWYSFSTRHSRETLLQGNTKVELKNLKNRYSHFMLPYFFVLMGPFYATRASTIEGNFLQNDHHVRGRGQY